MAAIYDGLTLAELEEMEPMMAWAEDEMVRMGVMKKEETELFDELITGLTFEDIRKSVIRCYKGAIPSHVVEDLLIKELEVKPGDRFAYNTLFVGPIINQKLAEKEPKWFNPRRVMPEFDDRIIRYVIGRKGYGLKQFAQENGATFIWFDRHMMAFKIWGKCPSMNKETQTIDDVGYNLKLMIEGQTERRFKAALDRLYRSTERKRTAAIYYCD